MTCRIGSTIRSFQWRSAELRDADTEHEHKSIAERPTVQPECELRPELVTANIGQSESDSKPEARLVQCLKCRLENGCAHLHHSASKYRNAAFGCAFHAVVPLEPIS